MHDKKSSEENLESVFRKIIEGTQDCRNYYYKKIYTYKEDSSERNSNAFNDMGELSRFIVKKLKKQQINEFEKIFSNIEEILIDCNIYVENLIVVGFFEGIQNIGDSEINYYYSFDNWLQKQSKSKWDNLIDFWEGKEWRENKKK